MTERFDWGNDRLSLTFEVNDDGMATVAGAAASGLSVHFSDRLPLVEAMIAGTGHWIACGRLNHTDLGRSLAYAGHRAWRDDENGTDRLRVTLRDAARGLRADVDYTLPDGVPMVRVETTVTNEGSETVSLEQVTSYVGSLGAPEGASAGIDGWTLLEGDYDWLGEGRWHSSDLRGLLPDFAQRLTDHDPRMAHIVTSTSTWSTGRHTPLAVLENGEAGVAWLFQVEHDGAWRWEVGDDTVDGYIAASGPTNVDHAWSVLLSPGESFTSVPASVALARDVDGAVRAVTDYRRAMRRRHEANEHPGVVFNDYMNTIYGDPTTAKELPLIAAAAEAGCDVFVIDCGWYDDSGDWWPSVGEWMPSTTRFPGPRGLAEVTDAIREAGMVPGLWLEPEVIGVKSPMADRLPDSAFFQRAGRRLVEQERYILDLRDPAARAHLDGVVDRLVRDFGVGYFKMDYNVTPGIGTDRDADSLGDGLLSHLRAYADWVDGILARHPGLILENCSSGGMREDFAQTSRFQVQSTSDQQDWRLYPTIAATAPMMMTPEQAASWAYPQDGMTPEQTAFNVNTTFLGRFFLSGYLNRMDPAQLAVVRQGIDAWRRHVQPVLASAHPFWPMGLPGWQDAALALGLDAGDHALVTVWARGEGTGREARLALPQWRGRDVEATPVYPVGEDFGTWPTDWSASDGELRVRIPDDGYVSRTFLIQPKGGR